MTSAQLLARALDRHRAGDIPGAEALYRQILHTAPSHFDALRLLGVALHGQNRNEEALQSLTRAAKVNPKAPLVHSDLSMVLQALGRPQEALASADRALALNPGQAEAIYNRANALLDLQRPAEALRGYDAMLLLAPDYAPALNNKGLALINLGRPAAALPVLDRALALQPSLVIAQVNRGNALMLLGRATEAMASFDAALALAPNAAEALNGRGNILMSLRHYETAKRDLRRAVELNPALDHTIGHLLHASMHVCDWRTVAMIQPMVLAGVRAGRRAIVPFEFAAASDAAQDQLLCARIYARHGPGAAADRIPRRPDRDRIRLGYVSGGLGHHATMILLAGLVERHDRARFEVVAFSSGGDDGSALAARGRRAFDQVHDTSRMDEAAIAALVRDQAIDIAVDLDGFTGMTRSRALASRPAPVQVSYLGFPGTMGAPWIDYILADRIVIPEDHLPFYDEKVVYLPDTYQVNDDRRLLPAGGPTRAEAGLPASGFVFCCFNNPYKLNEGVFDIWMRLLRQVDDGVLWLLAGEPALQRNLRREAASRGVSSDRIMFAPRLPPDQHLARHRLADLFLDTLPYNAHSTASDALWAGLPVLTCLGSAFPGRVGASLLHAVGLPELVATSLPEYEAMALDLATDRGKLAAFRARLEAGRTTAPLFDTDRFRRHIEAAYKTMWDRHVQGLAPAAFTVAPA